MLSRNSVYFGFFLFLLVTIAIIIVVNLQPKPADKLSNIQDFNACASAGYPVVQSYPRQCSLPSGKYFIEQTVAQECSNQLDCTQGQTCVNHACQKLTP